MLEGVYKSYRQLADQVEWKKYNCNELFFEYIKHENDDLGEKFFAGIVCRYWGYAGKIYTQCNYHIPFEECHDCVIDAIRYVLKNRVWENPNSSLYQDKAGPDKAIHIALKRQKGIMLSKYSAFRRLSNFNNLSLDEARENYNDSTDGMLFDFSLDESENSIRTLVSSYFDISHKDYLKGIILDNICFSGGDKFDIKSVVKNVKSVNLNLFSYYNDLYGADEQIYKNTLKTIYHTSNKLLEIKVKSLLYTLRKEHENGNN